MCPVSGVTEQQNRIGATLIAKEFLIACEFDFTQ